MAKKKTADKKPTLQNLPQHTEEHRRIFADRCFVVFGDEHFVIAIQSGESMDRQYALTPAHAQRLSDLLQAKLTEYKNARSNAK